jgi:hypothetical protein
MGLDASDLMLLSPKVREQIYRKLGEEKGKKLAASSPKNKYGAIKDEREGKGGTIKFDSRHEAERYDSLLLLLRAGVIRDLRLQVNFTLQEGYTTADGERVRPIVYRADFTYYTLDGEYIVEDAKSVATGRDKTYRLKRKLMLDKFGISVREV